MSATAWFRFFPSDWLSGTRGMSDRQTGVYIGLIAMMYDHREPLRDDPALLSRMCGSPSVTSFRKVLEGLIDSGKIIRTEAGLWNTRVGEELQVLQKNSDLQSHRAFSRWAKKDNKNKAGPMPRQSPGNAIPDTINHISTSLRSVDSESTPKTELRSVLDETHAKAVIDHRQRLRKPLTAHAARLLAIKLGRCPDPDAAADLMMEKGWQSIEPDWVANATTHRAQAPPQQDTMLDAIRRFQQREEAHDGPTIEASDYAGDRDSPDKTLFSLAPPKREG